MKRFLSPLLLAVFLAGCSPPPTEIPITLTPPPSVPTNPPVDIVPPLATGSAFVYVDGTTLVAVPHGPFTMGHGTADNPEHTVTLSDFWIYSTEVTNHQYSICESQGRCSVPNPSSNPGYTAYDQQNQPVTGVTYDQAREYCKYLNGDLPTEAQWEKAARGTDARIYPWGEGLPSCELLNFGSCLKATGNVTDHPQGASPYGALDMAGNVYEWVADWYDPLYYQSAPPGDPPGPASGRARVVRSSGFRSRASESVAYARSYSAPGDNRADLGFRCVVKDPRYFAPGCQLAPVAGPEEIRAAREDCPAISVDVRSTACRYGGGAVVTFNDDHPQDPNASFGGIVGCTLLSGQPGSFPLSYKCMRGSTAVMSSSCNYSGLRSETCAAHYTADASTGLCRWDAIRATGIDCPTGEFYDPVAHCCSVSSGDSGDFPVCPPGTVFTRTSPGAYVCFPAGSVGHVAPQSASVNPPVCPNLCDVTVDQCNARNLVFCETTCACLSVGVKCPTH